MSRFFRNLVACTLCLLVAGTALAGETIDLRLKDGSRWRGQVTDKVAVKYVQAGVVVDLEGTLVKASDLYVVVEGIIAGRTGQKTIFKSDLVEIRTLQAGSGESAAGAGTDDLSPLDAAKKERHGDGAMPADEKVGIFVLPLEGMVGEGFRHEEIEMIGEEADRYGRGQVIILMINSNGGLVLESEMVTEAIWELKKRHRVIAWVKKAISAGCSSAMSCDEIYFMTEGTAGSVTTISGLQHVPEEQAQPGIDFLVETAERSGYSPHIARAMKLTKYMCSYDKDPVTGDVTFYGDTSGEHLLSDDESNLCFNSSTALRCGFSKGTADTGEHLAELLDLPRWYETSDYGRRIAEDWQDTVETAKDDIQRLFARRGYYRASGSAEERIGALIKIDQQLIRWWDKAPNVCFLMGIPDKDTFEREIIELRKQLADLKRNGRGR